MTQKEITIELARKKLGERGERMTERQIVDLLATLRLLCNKVIDSVVDKK